MITIEFTLDELSVVGSALSALPFKDVAAIMGKLQNAYNESVKGTQDDGNGSPTKSAS